MDYVLHILVLISIYAILAASLDVLAGHSGNLALSHAAFFGIGAYTSALLTTALKAPFLIGLFAAAIVASLASMLISIPAQRLRSDYFVLVTFGFQMVVYSVFNNWVSVTNGPLGISAIPPPEIFGAEIDTRVGLTVLFIVIAIIAYVVIARITMSPFGRVLHALREDETFLAITGRDPLPVKLKAMVVSALFAGVAGSLFAHYMRYIDPSSFAVSESILILSIVIVGGAGHRFGPLIGAIVLVLLPEALRFVGLSSSEYASVRQILYGALLVLVVMFRPAGFLPGSGVGR